MAFLKKRPPLTREQSLKSVPVKNPHLVETRTETGEVILYLPRREVWWVKALSKILYIPKGRKLALDELGTNVWDLIDGKSNVGQLISRFAEKYRLSKREAELSIVAYLRMLAKRGIIGIAVFGGPRTRQGKRSKAKAKKK
ncbi:MAG TPA: PqqD family protein [Planctomycetota bacterium]|nr:PqqD family protein [Planctomycetota bacterium]